MREVIDVRRFRGTPDKPQFYPGERPDNSYLLLPKEEGANAYVMDYDGPLESIDQVEVYHDGKVKRASEVLHDLNETPIEKRIPVVGYGANRSPPSLFGKFRGKEVEGRPVSVVVPNIRGWLRNHDAVFSQYISTHGQVPAQLAPSEGTEVEAWLALLDEDQLRRMHMTEGVKREGSSLYSFGIMPFLFNDELYQAYIYFGGTIPVYNDPAGNFVRLASSASMDETVPQLAEGRTFASVEVKNPSFKERREVTMMWEMGAKVFGRFRKHLYLSDSPFHTELTEWGRDKSNRKMVNDYLKEHGKHLDLDLAQVDPFDFGALKRLKDVA